jgi:hypothetical protein
MYQGLIQECKKQKARLPHDIGGSMVLAENFSKATVRGVASFGHTERQVHQSSCRDRHTYLRFVWLIQ